MYFVFNNCPWSSMIFSLISPLWLWLYCSHHFTLNFLLPCVLSWRLTVYPWTLFLTLAEFKLIALLAADVCLGLYTNMHVLKIFHHEIILLKEILHPKMKSLSSFTHPQVVANLWFSFFCWSQRKIFWRTNGLP